MTQGVCEGWKASVRGAPCIPRGRGSPLEHEGSLAASALGLAEGPLCCLTPSQDTSSHCWWACDSPRGHSTLPSASSTLLGRGVPVAGQRDHSPWLTQLQSTQSAFIGKSTTEALYLSLEQTFFFHGLPWSLQDTSVQMQLCNATPHTEGRGAGGLHVSQGP